MRCEKTARSSPSFSLHWQWWTIRSTLQPGLSGMSLTGNYGLLFLPLHFSVSAFTPCSSLRCSTLGVRLVPAKPWRSRMFDVHRHASYHPRPPQRSPKGRVRTGSPKRFPPPIQASKLGWSHYPFDAEPAARDIVSAGDGGLGVGGDEDVAKENKRFFVYLCLWQFIEANP